MKARKLLSSAFVAVFGNLSFLFVFTNSAVTLADETLDEVLAKAVAAYGQGDYDLAASVLKGAAETSPASKEVFYWLGLTYREQGHYAQACTAFERVSQLDSKNPEPYALAADMYMRQRRFAEAVSWYEKALRLAPDDADLTTRIQEAKKQLEPMARGLPQIPANDANGNSRIEEKDEVRPAERQSDEDASPNGVDSPIVPEVEPDGPEDDQSHEFRKTGIVGQFSSPILGNLVGGIVGCVLFPFVVFLLSIKAFRIPLTTGELKWMHFIILCSFLLAYPVIWGSERHWRVIVVWIWAIFYSNGLCRFGAMLSEQARAEFARRQAAAASLISELHRHLRKDDSN